MFTQYKANKNWVFVRKKDNQLFGTILHLHGTDSIENYEHREATEKEVELLKEKGITWN
jgi:ssRNA-specific RNase YbeY (16S rRNA maturation enzyme)